MAASDALVNAAPERVEIAVPVVAVAPKTPVAPIVAAIGPAKAMPTPVPTRTPIPIPKRIFVFLLMMDLPFNLLVYSLMRLHRIACEGLVCERDKPLPVW